MSTISQDDDVEHKGILWFVLGAAVVLSLAMAIGTALWRSGVFAHGHKTAVVKTASGNMGGAVGMGGMTGAAADEASIKVVDGVVRFYFASGKADIAKGAKEALTEAVAAAKGGKKLVLSGYHDSTGGAQLNADLAKQRAFAVRDALLAQGVAESSIELKKPEVIPDTKGSDPEARRVDVKIE